MKVKAGDQVRALVKGPDITEGKIYTICKVNIDTIGFNVVDDTGDNFNSWLSVLGRYELVDDDAELNELRAFKEQALARFPALAESETDEEAANRFSLDYYNDVYDEPSDAILAAIAWARANPR